MDLKPGEEVLHSIFIFIATSGVPMLGIRPAGAHWELSPAECKKLNDAWGKASRHWAPQVSEKIADHVLLAQTIGTICGPRIVQTVFDRRAQRANNLGARTQPPSAAPVPANGPMGQVAAGSTAVPVAVPPGTAAGNGRGLPPGMPETPAQLDPMAMAQSGMTA